MGAKRSRSWLMLATGVVHSPLLGRTKPCESSAVGCRCGRTLSWTKELTPAAPGYLSRLLLLVKGRYSSTGVGYYMQYRPKYRPGMSAGAG
jgi:hypothetical protein